MPLTIGFFLTVTLATTLGVLVAMAAASFVRRLLLHRLQNLGLQPRQAPSAEVPNCSVPNDPATAPQLTTALSGGVIRGPSIVLADGEELRLTSNLVLVSDGDLHIDGDILNAPPPSAAPYSINITLISLNGSVIIGRRAVIGYDSRTGSIAPPTVVGPKNVGPAGTTGGWIKIVAVQGSIVNDGKIKGFPGTNGADANMDTQGTIPSRMADLLGLPATTVSGGGGNGGHVLLCALEAITNNGSIVAGRGRAGGTATSEASGSATARAQGGQGGDGGNVMLDGLATSVNTGVENAGTMTGGMGGTGGAAIAHGGGRGGRAIARAGDAGKGGTVLFDEHEDARMSAVGTVQAATGGNGGLASAYGGPGMTTPFYGLAGGDAEARAGDGGKDGPTKPIPLMPNTLPGSWGPVEDEPGLTDGTGGNATVIAGRGGAGMIGGGPSGRHRAQGGTGKGGTAPPPAPPPPAAPAPPVGNSGGALPPAMSFGTP